MAELNITFFEKHSTKILFFGLILIIVSPLFLTLPAISKYLDFSKTGQIGDTIGGITSPIINFLGAVLVYISFKSQQRANEQQWKAIKHEDRIKYFDLTLKKIEDLLFEISKEKGMYLYSIQIRDSLNRKEDISHYYAKKNIFRIKLGIFLNTFSNFCERLKKSNIDLEIKENYFSELFLRALDQANYIYILQESLSKFILEEKEFPNSYHVIRFDLISTLEKLDKFVATYEFCSKIAHNES